MRDECEEIPLSSRRKRKNQIKLQCPESKKALADIEGIKSIILKITEKLENSNNIAIAKDDILDIRCLLTGDQQTIGENNENNEDATVQSITAATKGDNDDIIVQTLDSQLPSMIGKEREVFFTIISRKLELKEQGFVHTKDILQENDDSLVVVKSSTPPISTSEKQDSNCDMESFFSFVSQQQDKHELLSPQQRAQAMENKVNEDHSERNYATGATGIPLRNVRPYQVSSPAQPQQVNGDDEISPPLVHQATKEDSKNHNNNIGIMALNLLLWGATNRKKPSGKSQSGWAGVPLLKLPPYQEVVQKTNCAKSRNVHNKWCTTNHHQEQLQQPEVVKVFKRGNGIESLFVGEDETETTMEDSSSHSDFLPLGIYPMENHAQETVW